METNSGQQASTSFDRSSYVPVVDSKVNEIDKVLYTAYVHATGGRDGHATSSDKELDVDLSSPTNDHPGTNPEQLFAAGWSACFTGAMQLAAAAKRIRLPKETALDTEVDLSMQGTGYFLQGRLYVSLPGMELEEAKALVEAAHSTCPYSKGTQGNINVEINVAV